MKDTMSQLDKTAALGLGALSFAHNFQVKVSRDCQYMQVANDGKITSNYNSLD